MLPVAVAALDKVIVVFICIPASPYTSITDCVCVTEDMVVLAAMFPAPETLTTFWPGFTFLNILDAVVIVVFPLTVDAVKLEPINDFATLYSTASNLIISPFA